MFNLFAGITLAQELNLDAPDQFSNLSNVRPESVIEWAIGVMLIVASIIFFFMLVLGGIKWITSGGDKGKTEAARNQITAALVGLVIVFASWAIVALVGTIFGVNLLSLNIGTLNNP